MRITLRIALFLLLTILTQIGGLVYLLSSFLSKKIFTKNKRWKRLVIFLLLYISATWLLVPMLSPRKAMPVFEENVIRPVTILTCLLNRHYVSAELYKVLDEVNYPHTIQYMDANFPFLDGFPLLPHLSHDDGDKIDLAFQYGTGGTDLQSLRLPTFMGYGSFELPEEDEVDMAAQCKDQGGWQYSLTSLIPSRSTDATFHHYRTQQLIKNLARHPKVRKIFIEPHLKVRMGLKSAKIRFHGCHAVRHDDHIHVEL